MGRIRTIKPEFWRHEALSELPEATHMLAAALLNYADDEGYFNANERLIQAECCPLREPSVSIHDSLMHLSRIGYVRLYRGTDGRTYGHVVSFAAHQKVNRPTPSKIKPLLVLTEGSVSPPGSLSDPSLPEQGTGKGNREGKGKEEGGGGARAAQPAGEDWTDDELLDRVMQAAGITGAPIPTYWLPPQATLHVGRWRRDLAIPGARIVEAVRRKQAEASSPPRGPKAFDTTMQVLAGELQAAPMRPEAQASPPPRGAPPAHKPLTIADLRAMVIPATERPQ